MIAKLSDKELLILEFKGYELYESESMETELDQCQFWQHGCYKIVNDIDSGEYVQALVTTSHDSYEDAAERLVELIRKEGLV
jgi:hypothetical protein